MKNDVNRRDFLRIGGLALAGILAGATRIESSSSTADTAFVNGTILTVDGRDSVANALAIRNGTILDVGTREAVVPYISITTRVIDLKGRVVTPGLIDAHGHLPHFGNRERNWVKLQGIESKEEVLERLADRARKTPEGRFINGWGIESIDLSFMNRRDLDRITTSHPVLLVHTTGQWGFANSYALKASGVDRSTPNPPGGRVQKARNGEPTGLLIHYPALYLVRKNFPLGKEEAIRKNILHGAHLYAREGVTTVHDNFFSFADIGDAKLTGTYLDQALSGTLPVRLKIWPYIPSAHEATFIVRELLRSEKPRPDSPLTALIQRKRDMPDKFASIWGGMKIAIDGAGPTAMWYRGERNLTLHSVEDLRSMVKLFHRENQQISVHAVGDKAVDVMLDAFEEAFKTQPGKNARHRIEHAMCPQTTSLERIERLGVVICTHPQFLYPWADKWTGLRGQRVIPLKSYRERGIPVALGADPPAFPLWQPQYALWDAVSRMTKGGYIFAPEEAISVREALRMHTMGSAYAAFQEKDVGSLEKGKLADLVVWDRNFYTVPTDQVRDAKAELTMVGGKIVYQKDRTA